MLQKHFDVGLVSRASPGSNYSFFLGPVSSAPAYLIRKLPDKVRDISPRCFIALIPDINNPIVWIGGKSVSDFLQTAEFLKDMLPCLLQNNLIAGDFHIHTTVSDGKTKPEEVGCFAAQAGLDAIAVTDHYNVNGAKKARAAAPAGFPVLIGEETTDSRGNHLLVYGLKNSIMKGITPKAFIDKWFFAGLLLVQAHPTDQIYFKIKGARAVGVEVFNFLSSSPRKARDYAESALKKGCKIAVLGCSDAHLPQDIGKAKTYLLVSHFNSDAILQSISGGETVAFYQGNFCGKEPFRELLSNLYLHSNLLGGKLVPLSKMAYFGFPYLKSKAKCFAVKKEREIWCQLALPFKQGVINIETDSVVEGYLDDELIIFQNNGGRFPFYQSRGPRRLTLRLENKKKTSVSLTPSGPWLNLKPENYPPAKRIFCPFRPCHCREKWFSLKRCRFPFLLDCGSRQQGRIKFNSFADYF
ncbi:MAG: PHP domain-containing protein, partial [Kiritimatiellia bacterium]|nr:PHP domain-containing protein [Kiritimatiellia bacterium]